MDAYFWLNLCDRFHKFGFIYFTSLGDWGFAMKIDNKMPDSFFDWLSKCPVQWHLGQWDKESMDYTFIVPDEESEEDND